MIEVKYEVKDNKCLTLCPFNKEYYDGNKIMVHSMICKDCSSNGGVTEDGKVECHFEN